MSDIRTAPGTRQRTKARGGYGSAYRGGLAMWAAVGQRISGMVIYIFLLVHVADNLMLRVSPDAYDEVITSYKTIVMAIGEIGLVAALLGHALNGVRIVLIDLWGNGPRYARPMLWAVVALWVALMLPFFARHLSHYI
ncbi:succinate dehydrogenase, cytochrome b556 subunit [Nocardia tengchongensis]